MKRTILFNLTLAVVALATGVSGCKSKGPDKGITVIRGQRTGTPQQPPPIDVVNPPGTTNPLVVPYTPPIVQPRPIGSGDPLTTTPQPRVTTETILPNSDGIIAQSKESFQGWPADRNAFAQHTAYFDYDSSVVKQAYVVKLSEIATVMKGSPQNKILIEGHCDERGTEEYNRALGERRALALREKLVKAGVPAAQVHTISYGKDRAAQPGHEESSWSKNRRGEFVMLHPPTGTTGASLK